MIIEGLVSSILLLGEGAGALLLTLDVTTGDVVVAVSNFLLLGVGAAATLGWLVTTDAPMHFFFLVQGWHQLSRSSTPNFARHFLVSVGAGNEIGRGHP